MENVVEGVALGILEGAYRLGAVLGKCEGRDRERVGVALALLDRELDRRSVGDLVGVDVGRWAVQERLLVR
jgi:hypothetical protein